MLNNFSMDEKEIFEEIRNFEKEILDKLSGWEKYFKKLERKDKIDANLSFNNPFYQKLVIPAINICMDSYLYNKLIEDDEAMLPNALADLRSNLLEEKGFIVPAFEFNCLESLRQGQYMIFIRNDLVYKGEVNILSRNIPDIITNKLFEELFLHSDKIITREVIWNFLKVIEKTDTSIVKELYAKNISITTLRQTFVNLLKERVSIKDIRFIFQKILELKINNPSPDTLSENLRQYLTYSITNDYILKDLPVKLIYLSDELHNAIIDSTNKSQGAMKLSSIANMIVDSYNEFNDREAFICVDQSVRLVLYRSLVKHIPDIKIISKIEINDLLEVDILGTIELNKCYKIEDIELDDEAIEESFEDLFLDYDDEENQ